MSSGLYYAISGFKCQEREMEILSHGLSNVNTTGYKDDLPSFKGVHAPFNSYLPLETLEDHRHLFLMQKMNMDYPGLSYVQTDFSQGQLKYTGSDFNIAIEGEGFLVIDTPQGERYTRLGNLSLNRKNELVVGGGNYPLKAEIKGEKKKKKEPYIKIQEIKKDFVIGRDGAIAVDGIPLNTLKVVDFKDYSQLKKIGDHLYENLGGKENEKAAEGYEIRQHHVELSNIRIVQKMIKMINVARTCETYQKVIHAMDEMDARATRDVGAVA